MGKLTGRFAIVTGAGKGIGKAIVQRFLEDDVAGVALFDMDEELVKATAKELDPTSERAIAVRCNVADQADVNAAVAAVTEKFGRIDILINNAGITRDAMFHKMSSEQAHMVMDVNFFGTFNCCQAVIKGMREQCYGKIVNISSVSTFGSLGQTNYSASKCAIEGFTRTLAIESGMKNITVNCVSPGTVSPSEEADITFYRTEPMCYMGRSGTDLENANLICFLVSDEASYISGQNIQIDGCRKKM